MAPESPAVPLRNVARAVLKSPVAAASTAMGVAVMAMPKQRAARNTRVFMAGLLECWAIGLDGLHSRDPPYVRRGDAPKGAWRGANGKGRARVVPARCHPRVGGDPFRTKMGPCLRRGDI